MKEHEDPGIDWIRKVRHEISAEFDHDSKKLVEHYRNLEAKYAARILRDPEQAPKTAEPIAK